MTDQAQTEMDMQMQRATEVQQRYGDYLLSKPHVVGLGVGYATQSGVQTPEVALIVMVDQKIEAQQLGADAILPKRLDGVRIDVQEMGAFFAS